MKVKALMVLSLILWMGLATVSCGATPRPSQTDQPEATHGSGPTALPILTERPEPTEDFGPSPGPLIFAPETLPVARTGELYEVEIGISGNVTPVDSFSLSSGALPTGVELVFMDGEDAATLSGKPETAGTSTFTLSVSCFGTQVSGQRGDKEYTLSVVD